MLCGQCGHGVVVWAVAFIYSVRDVERRAVPHVAQPCDQQGSRGTAVDIVIGENGNAFAPFQRGQKARRGVFHILQGSRVGQQVAQGRCQERLCLGGIHPAPRQNLGHGAGQACGLCQCFSRAVNFDAGAHPTSASQAFFDPKKTHGGSYYS